MITSCAVDFTRMLDIYHAIYGQYHYLLGVALSNLAGAYLGKKEWSRAESFRASRPDVHVRLGYRH